MPDKKLNLSGANKILSSEGSDLNLDAASAILKKKDQPISLGFGIGLEPSRPYRPAVLTEAGERAYDLEQAKKQAAADRLSQRLNKNLATYAAAQGIPAAEQMLAAGEVSAKNQLEAVIQKDLGNSGNLGTVLYNKILQGTGSALSGALDAGLNALRYSQPTSPLVTDATIDIYRKDIAPDVKKFLVETIGADVDKGTERKFDENFFTGALGGLAYSLPAMATPYGVGLFSQAYDSGLESINSTKAGAELPEWKKTLYAGAIGGVVGSLEKLGLEKIIKADVAPSLVNYLAVKAFRDIPKAGGKITQEALESFVKREVNAIKPKLLNIAEQGYKGGLIEGLTGGGQELATVGAEQLTNYLNNDNIFDKQSLGELAGRVIKSAGQEALGGKIMGGLKGAMPINTKSYLIDRVVKAKTDDDIAGIVGEIEDFAVRNNYAPEQVDDIVANVNDYIAIKNKVPAELGDNQVAGIIPLIQERNDLSDSLTSLESQFQNTDDALKGSKVQEIELVRKQIDSINNQISEIANNPDYAVQVKTAGEIPVQPEARVGEEVAQGEPQAEPQAVTEVIQEEVDGGKIDDTIFYTGRGKKYEDLKNTKGEFIFFSKNPKISEWYGGDESNVSSAKLDTSNFLDLTSQENKTDFVKKHFTDSDIKKLYIDEIKFEKSRDIFGKLTDESLIEKYRKRAEENAFSGDGKEQKFLLKKIKESGYSGVKLLDTFFGKPDVSYVVLDKSIINKAPEEIKPKEKITIGVAPFREINVSSLDQDAELRSTPEYKQYVKNIARIARGLGLNISQSAETWGGYVDSETGRPVQEVSNMLQIQATPEEARVLAAILGKTAPEMQDSVLVGSFNENGSGAEHTIKTGSFENATKAIEFLKKNGLEYFTIDKNTGDIIILDMDGSSVDNIINFNNELNENGINTEHTAYPVEAEFVGRDDYDGILAEQGRKIGEERGVDINAIVESATKRFQKGKRKVAKATSAEVLPQGETGLVTTVQEQAPEAEQATEEQKRLGASRIVGEAITPEEITEFEEVSDADAEAKLKDSIETPFKNKEKLEKTSKGLVARIMKAAIDSQYEVIQKLLKSGGDLGKLAVATLRNRKGYNGKASILVRKFNEEIFDNLSINPNIDVAGRKTSERELFDVFLNLNRIINIDNRISEKFAQLVNTQRKLREGIADGSLNEEQQKFLSTQIENLFDYLDKRNAVRIENGEYVPVQYKHSGNRTAASARAELKVLKNQLPEIYSKFEDLSNKYYDAYRFLLDEQYKNGMIAKEVYDELFSYNYIPTKYIQHFIENELSQDNPALASKLSSTIKNLTGGSDSDVITNFQAILELYTNSVYKRIYENRAAKSLSNAVISADEKNKGVAKFDQAVADANAGLNKLGVYNMKLDMYIQEPSGFDKFGNPTYDKVPSGYDVIYFYENGKRQRIVAPIDFVDAWYDRGTVLSPKGERYLSFVSKWSGVNLFKSLITKNNPAFGLFQILMDAPQALIATQAYPDFIIGSAQLASDYASVSKDILAFIKNDNLSPLFKEAIDAGIFSDFLSTENDILKSQTLVNADGKTNYKTAAKALMGRLGKAADTTLNSIAQFNEAIEYATRLAVYKRMKQNLTSKYEKENAGKPLTDEQRFEIQQLAAEQSRNVVDFSRSGTIIRPLNKVLAYLNAGIQGFYSSARGLKNNPTKAAIMLTEIGLGGVAVLAMSIGAYGDDKERKKRLAEYLMLSKYQRSNYFNIYNPYSEDPEKRWVKIPKPQGLRGWINMLEQGYLSTVMGVDISEQVVKEAFLNDIPVEPTLLDLITRNPLVNATVKYQLNKDVFRNQDVVRNAEKIEDWAEGIDDPNVSKFYKQLGKSTKDLFGGEGISPKRAQEFTQSLIGDPSRNTTTALLDKAGKTMFYAITNNKEGLKEEYGDDAGDFILKTTGIKGRLFTKTPKLDNSFMEGLDEKRRETFTKRMIIRSDIESIFENADTKQEAEKIAIQRLNELIKEKEITPEYKKRILSAQKKQYVVADKPSWYKSLLYSETNDEKVDILKHYTKGMSDDDYKKTALFLIKNKIISPEVTKEFAQIRKKNEK